MNLHPTAALGAPITSYLRAELETLARVGRGPFTGEQIDAELAQRDAIRFYMLDHPEAAHA